MTIFLASGFSISDGIAYFHLEPAYLVKFIKLQQIHDLSLSLYRL